jgi:glycosyltransferase involved in cell wall biosynthesis
MKTILFSDNHLWALYNFRGGVIRAFLNNGYKIIVVAPINYDHELDNTISGVEFIPVYLERTSKSILNNFQYFTSILKIYRKSKPEIIFHYTVKPIFFGSIAAKIFKIPSVAVFAGLSNVIINKVSLPSSIFRKLLKIVLDFPQRVVFLNTYDYEFMLNEKLINPNKVQLFKGGEGVNLEIFKPSFPLKQNANLRFVMVARILYSKGYKEFIEAAQIVKSKFPHVHFILCGEIDKGHPQAVDEKIILKDSMNGNFEYKGRVNNVLEILQKCDCFILPSYYTEGMNRSLMEALAVGLPIITTDNRGCKEMVKDKITGFIIQKKTR